MVAEIKSGYGSRLDALRTALGLSITDFAQKADIAGSSMSLILREVTKNPSIGVFVSLSKSVNANLNWMAFGEGEMFISSDSGQKKNHRESLDGGAFGSQVAEQMENRIQELKDQVDNLKYIVNLQRQMLEQSNGMAVSAGKLEGAIQRPLWAPESFEELMQQYKSAVLGGLPASPFFLASENAKLVAPRSFV